MYKVIEDFTDLQDNNHYYRKNDVYPHSSKNIEEISKERIKELSTKKNKRGIPLIAKVEEEVRTDEKEKSKKNTNK